MKKFGSILFFCLLFINLQAAKVESAKFTVQPGETVTLPENYIKFNALSEIVINSKKFQSVSVGCGHNMFQGCWIELDPTEFTQYQTGFKRIKDADGKTVRLLDSIPVGKPVPYSVSAKKGLKLSILSEFGTARFTIEGKSKEEFDLKSWANGGPLFVKNRGSKPIEVEMSFTRLGADEAIWFYGDSYFSVSSRERWPYYMKQEGYLHWMADHKSGGGSDLLIKCLKHDLEYGTPKYIVWLLGMNDGSDKDGKPSERWMKGIEELLGICKEKGITPILATIPSVPARGHREKTEWVRKSGYRYVEWYGAVTGSEDRVWKEGYLSKDKVHPSAEGAKALWEAVKIAVPELEK